MALTPLFYTARGSMLPLRGLQLLCCAAVVSVGMHVSNGFELRADAARAAMAAFDATRLGESPVDAALLAASAGLSRVNVEVRRNDTLDQIFRRLELSLADLANIRALEVARNALDRLRPGDLLTVFKRGNEVVALSRPLALDQTLHVERHDAGFVASLETVPLQRETAAASGTIVSSLYAAGAAAGLRNSTIDALADVFQWDVDFFHLQGGESFRLVYEQLKRDGKVVADGDILAAEFVDAGKPIRAVRYTNPQGKVDFYTPEGISLRKPFLKAPLKFKRISSVFNPRRRHPVLNTIRAHRGVDYAAATGTPVLASGNGRVQFRGVKGGYGNVVEISHGKVTTLYGHLSRFAAGLNTGSKVEQGQVIGYVGSTGLATGPHLHFEYIESGRHIDPERALRRGEPGPPVPATEKAFFLQQTAPLLAQLAAHGAGSDAALASR